MRRFAGIGVTLLALAGCQSLPGIIRIEVDGSTLDFKKKEPPVTETLEFEPGTEPATGNDVDTAP